MGALRRLAHVTVMAVLALSMTLFATLGGLWIWSGTEGSLATAAQLAVRFLPNLFPDSQTEPVLVLQGVTGKRLMYQRPKEGARLSKKARQLLV